MSQIFLTAENSLLREKRGRGGYFVTVCFRNRTIWDVGQVESISLVWKEAEEVNLPSASTWNRELYQSREYIFRNGELYQSLGIYFLKQCEVEAAVAIFVSWLLAELLMLRRCSFTDVWIFPMSFRSVTKHLRVLPFLKVYLLKLALKKEKEMLQKIWN